MAENATQRKLTAIMSADVKGYSKLMGDDDESTVNTITAYRKIISELIKKHQGRVVDNPGDNVLAEFESTLNAVNSAIEIQISLEAENSKLPDNRRMDFRIGINLGDILHKDDRIYGNGVNVAARIESLADPGGICISRGVFDQVKQKVSQGFQYLGERTVKNIPEPVRIYRILLAPEDEGIVIEELSGKPAKFKKSYAIAIAAFLICGAAMLWVFFPKAPDVEPASEKAMEYPLPDKPSIAVLPFDNMSIDPEQEYFCDGLTEEIITALSKIPKVFVIARNSVFTYKGKPIKVNQVAEELGVRYVLEGSVRKGGDKLRITAQLIDAISGHHLWAERYDRDIDDIFAVQDELTKKIITAMQVELTSGEQARVDAGGTNNLQAYLKFVEARENVNKLNIEGNTLGRKLVKEAIELDPQYAMAYRVLAATHRMDVLFGLSKSPKESYGTCIKLLKKAIELDATYAEAYGALGFTLSLLGQHDKAIATAERAIEIDPNSATTYAMLGHTFRFADRPKEAIQAYTKAIRHNPIPPTFYKFGLGLSYCLDGQYEKGIEWCKKAVQQNPDDFFARIFLIAAYSMAGQYEKAQTEVKEALRINPKYSLEKAEKRAKYKYRDRMFAALRKAGLPENPLQKLPKKPSIAVLPFENMSGDPNQEYFSDGITEDLITDLSKISGLLVIARTSTFTYKGKPVNVQQAASDLGVRYVLEGSVRKASDKIRINAQLIDTLTGHNLWADRFDGKIGDIFELQDSFTQKIVTALSLRLTGDERKNFTLRYTDSVEAYDAYLKGREQFFSFTRDGLEKSVSYFEKAIAIDPEYSLAHAGLAHVYLKSIEMHYNEELGWADARVRAQKHLQKAMQNPTPYTLYVIAKKYLFQRRYDEAITAAQNALTLDPNNSNGHLLMGMILIFDGRSGEALNYFRKGMKLDPQYPATFLYYLGLAQYFLKQYEASAANIEKSRRLAPQYGPWPMAITYAQLDRGQEAADILARYFEKRGWPVVLIENTFKSWPFKERKDMDHWAEGLRKSGLMRPWNPVYRREYEKAIADAEEAIIRDTNSASAQYTMGESLVFCGRSAEAIDYLQKAMSLDPEYPGYYLYTLGLAQFCLEQYDEAAYSLENCYYKRKMHSNPPVWLLVATYAYLGKQDDAKDLLEKYIKKNSFEDFTVKTVLKYHLHAFKEPDDTQRFAQGLHMAGLPLN